MNTQMNAIKTLSERECEKILSNLGVRFVQRQWGLTSAKTVTLTALTLAMNEAAKQAVEQPPNKTTGTRVEVS